MKKNTQVRIIHDFEDASMVFPGVHLDAGANYFLWERDYSGLCNYFYHTSNGEIVESKRLLENKMTEYVIRDSRIITILNKTTKGKMFSEIVSSTKPYGIRKYLFNDPGRYPDANLSESAFPGSIKIYGVKGIKGGAKRKVGFINPEIISDESKTKDLYKLFFTTSFTTNAIVPPEIIIGDPGEVCTETFLVIGPFGTPNEQKNCKKYMETKFFRFLLRYGKGTMQVQKSVFSTIPLIDFTNPYSNTELYKMFNLTPKEVLFIEQTYEAGLMSKSGSKTQAAKSTYE